VILSAAVMLVVAAIAFVDPGAGRDWFGRSGNGLSLLSLSRRARRRSHRHRSAPVPGAPPAASLLRAP
jgi:hypothetical protein